MPYNNFLDDLSQYNAKAAIVISQASADGNTAKANMMSSLKSTANNTALSETVRLNALTALINFGSLLDIPLPPYFPLTITYANTQTYVGIHDDLSGLQGGAPGDYQHLTTAERNAIANAATVGDITWAHLSGSYTDNIAFATQFNAKQDALTGPGYVKMVGGVVTYDTSTFLTTISGIAAGGELTGTFPNPNLSNAAVINKVLTGWNGSVSPAAISSADSILSALQKLNANINDVIANPSGVASVALTTNSGGVFTTTTSPQTGAATLDVSLNSQSASRFLASPTSASGVPTFRAFSATDLPNSGATAGTYGSSTFIPQIVVDAKGRITSISSVASASGGQVNSVSLSIPPIFGTVTNTGTAVDPILTYGLANQSANLVFAGPATGAATTPSFRSLVSDDIPSLDPSKITGLTALLSTFLTGDLSDGKIWIGNTSNAATPRTLTGDVTVSNTGVTAIGTSKVQYSMIQDVTAQTLLGRYELTNGVVQQVTLSGDFILDDMTGVLSLSSPIAPILTTKGDLLSFTTTQDRLPSSTNDGDILMVYNTASNGFGLQWNTINGDVTVTDASTGEITIANSVVTLGKMANLAANSVIGNNTGSAATPIALTQTQLTAMINQFSSTLAGVVPASGGGTTNYLRADGTWSPISGAGTGTVNSGTQYQLAYYATTGTAVSGLTAPTASRALVSDANGLPAASTTTTTQLQYLSSATGTTGTTSTNLVFSDSPVMLSPQIGNTATTGHIHFRKAGGAAPTGYANYATMWFPETGGNKRMAIMWDNVGYASEFQLDATGAQTYTFPNASGTVTLLGNSTTGSGNIVLATSPVLTTPSIGAATGTSLDVTGALTSGVASSAAGQLILRNATSSATQTLRGTNPTTSIIYDLPTTAPSAGQVLQASAPSVGVVTLSWANAGTGNVVGPASSSTGNFAVYADTTGTLLDNPSVATLSATGRATFNSGVDVGASSSTTGTIVFRNSANAFTTTIQQGSTSTASASYTWPLAPGSAGQILSTDGSGNLSWTAAGSGDMTTTTNQTVTGVKTFGAVGNVGKLAIAGTTSGSIVLAAPATSSGTVTFPNGTQTLAGLATAQSFTALQTFTAGLTVSTGATTFSTAGSTTTAQVTFSGTTNNWINFGTTGIAAPALGTRPVGVKAVLYNTQSALITDFALGMTSATEMYIGSSGVASGALNNTQVSFYNSTRRVGSFTNTGLVLSQATTTVTTVSGEGNFGPQLTINPSAANSYSQGTTAGYIRFWTSVSSAPSSSNTRPNGTRIVLEPNIGINFSDYAIGVDTANYETWITGGVSGATNGGMIGFWVGNGTQFKRTVWITQNALNITDAGNIVLQTTTGTKIGTATNQLLGFWNATPIVQPTTAVASATRAAVASTNIQTSDTFDGYTVAQVVKALRNTGILA